jgi:hypothetical protein
MSKTEQRAELEQLVAAYDGPVIRTRADIHLRQIMGADAKAWRHHQLAGEHAAPEEPAIREITAMRRVVRPRRAVEDL